MPEQAPQFTEDEITSAWEGALVCDELQGIEKAIIAIKNGNKKYLYERRKRKETELEGLETEAGEVMKAPNSPFASEIKNRRRVSRANRALGVRAVKAGLPPYANDKDIIAAEALKK